MTNAFIDTNILLHFKVFEGIKWDKFLGDKDYALVICPTVLDEIDKHKDSSKSRIKNRAKKIFHILSDYLDGKKFNNVNVEFYDNPELQFKVSDYNGAREDEYIVATANCFDKEGRKVIVTNDLGMKFRALKYNLEVLMPPNSEDFLLAEELTEEEVELKKVRQELDKYKKRLPIPFLTFNEGEEVLFINSYASIDIKEEIMEYEDKLRESLPYYTPLITSKNHKGNAELYSEDDINTYNSSIDKYIAEMIKIKEEVTFNENLNKYIYPVKFSLYNRGTIPSGNMGVAIVFPEELLILNEEDLIESEISIPHKPVLKSAYQKKLEKSERYCKNIYATLSYIPQDFDSEDFKYWNINADNKRDYFVNLPSLNHNLNMNFEFPEKLYVLAPNPGEYIIKWAVTDEHNIDPTLGELKIIAV